jgi:arabinofuranosyltransferase
MMWGTPSSIRTAALCAAVTAVVGLMFATGWLSDDAFITLRVIDNLWHGYGLRWNVLERVQVFTHPLWMLSLAAAYGVTREAFWTTIVLSMALSAGGVVTLARRLAADAAASVVALSLVAASKSVIEFSTSALENPLSHALLLAFFPALWRGSDGRPRLFRAAFLAGLSGLCRLDLLVLVGPPLAAAAWDGRHEGRGRLARVAMLAASPILVWWAFAFVYYGSIWPNTALAKLPSNVGLVERVPQGLRYLADTAIVDPVTVGAIAAAVAWAWWRGRDRAVALSLTAALAYVVAVGGDFMTGRFLSAPAVVAVAFLTFAVPWRWRGAAAVAAASLGLALAMPQSPLRVWPPPRTADAIVSHGAGIVDERAVYAPYTSVVAVVRGSGPRDHPWARGGRSMALAPGVKVFEAVGLLGYYAGPAVHIVDPVALTDPLLARQPADHPWRIGHFRRPLPRGYVERLQACVAHAFPGHAIAPPTRTCVSAPTAAPPMDPAVADAYARIAMVTQLPLFDVRRMAVLRRGGL